jgi:hypothetical protein
MSTKYLLKASEFELDEMVKFMARSDKNFITKQIIFDEDRGTYDNGFVIVPVDKHLELWSAKRTNATKEPITKSSDEESKQVHLS